MSKFTTFFATAATGLLLLAGNAQAGFFKAKIASPASAPMATTAPSVEKTPLSAEQETNMLASVSSSLREMSRAERHAKAREVRTAINDWKSHKYDRDGGGNKLACIILAIFIPPLAVALYEHGITAHFWISLLLTILFFLPGMIYSIIVIAND